MRVELSEKSELGIQGHLIAQYLSWFLGHETGTKKQLDCWPGIVTSIGSFPSVPFKCEEERCCSEQTQGWPDRQNKKLALSAEWENFASPAHLDMT